MMCCFVYEGYMKLYEMQKWNKNGDFWLLKKESCDWIPLWKAQGKKNNLRTQWKYIEKVYDNTKISPNECL